MARWRRTGGRSMVIRDNRFHELDELSDLVWRACDGVATVREIADRLAARKQMAWAEAMAATLIALASFRALELIELELVAGASEGQEP